MAWLNTKMPKGYFLCKECNYMVVNTNLVITHQMVFDLPIGGGRFGLRLLHLIDHINYTNTSQHHNQFQCLLKHFSFVPFSILYYSHHLGRCIICRIVTWVVLKHSFSSR